MGNIFGDEYQNEEIGYLLNLKEHYENGGEMLTGKPSKDRPWIKYYSREEISSKIVNQRMYLDLEQSVVGHESEYAIDYFGNKITYGKLIREINRTASAFVQMGVKKGDVVSISMPFLPETIYAFYALNKIGAVINMMDPRIDDALFSYYLNECNSKWLVTVNKIEEKVARIKNRTSLEGVVSVSAFNSMNKLDIKRIKQLEEPESKFITWNNFIKKSRGKKIPVTEPLVGDEVCVIEHTSGTTGMPKGVVLSNGAFNYLNYCEPQSLNAGRGNKFLLIMPPFIAYGLVIGMHDMLCSGQQLIMEPRFKLEESRVMLKELLKKHKPEIIMGVPNFLSVMMEYDMDLSFLKKIIIGGDHLDPEIEKKAIEYLRAHNCNADILKGWGMTELASCATLTKVGFVDGHECKNKPGSVGIPLSKNNIKIFPRNEEGIYDVDGEELDIGEEGILFVTSPSIAIEYYKNPEMTENTFYVDKTGLPWINTGDLFRMDEEGYLFFGGREKRIVVRPDGHNVPVLGIESIVSALKDVKFAGVVGVKNKDYDAGEDAWLCVQVTDKSVINEVLKTALLEIKGPLYERDRPVGCVIIDEVCHTSNGKIDYNTLKKNTSLMIDRNNGYRFDYANDKVIPLGGTNNYEYKFNGSSEVPDSRTVRSVGSRRKIRRR